jgi:hypothetical protein
MIYYRLTHFFITKQAEHLHYFDIGIYNSKAKAEAALAEVRDKPGFSLRPHAFRIRKVFRFRKPKLVDQTYWIDGFETYTYTRK